MSLNIFTESTLNEILSKLKLQNAYLSILAGEHELDSWEAYKLISDAGHLPEVLSVGDTLTETWTDLSASPAAVYTVSFEVMDFGDAEDENGNVYHNKAFLRWKKATPYTLPLDEKERVLVDLETETTAQANTYYIGYNTTNELLELETGDPLPTTYSKLYKNAYPSTGIVSVGYNRWKCSAYRKWLNSDAAANGWWTSDHVGDAAPSQHGTKPGFLSGFSESFRSLLRAYKVRTLLSNDGLHGENAYEDTYDKVFLPSVEQMMGIPEVSGVEGSAWQAVKNAGSLTAPTNGAVPSRAAEDLITSGTNRNLRLRTPVLNNSSKVYYVNTAGAIASDNPFTAARCTPVIIL